MGQQPFYRFLIGSLHDGVSRNLRVSTGTIQDAKPRKIIYSIFFQMLGQFLKKYFLKNSIQ
jgi:hypothetical protein